MLIKTLLDFLRNNSAGLYRTFQARAEHTKVHIEYPASLFGCEFGIGNKISSGCSLVHVKLGDYSYVANRCNLNYCTVGKFTSIGPGVCVGLGRHPTSGFVSTYPGFYASQSSGCERFVHSSVAKSFPEHIPVKIGNDVWLGAKSIILDGAVIGDGAIVGAGAVVVGEVKPYSIVAGVPAKTIRIRFEEEVVNKLLRIAWWNFPVELLKKYAAEMHDIERFLKALNDDELNST